MKLKAKTNSSGVTGRQRYPSPHLCLWWSHSKHEILTQCCFNAMPPSAMLAQHWSNIGSMYRDGWDARTPGGHYRQISGIDNLLGEAWHGFERCDLLVDIKHHGHYVTLRPGGHETLNPKLPLCWASVEDGGPMLNVCLNVWYVYKTVIELCRGMRQSGLRHRAVISGLNY